MLSCLQVLVETTGGAKYTAADSQRMLKDLNLTQQVGYLVPVYLCICAEYEHEVQGHAGLRLCVCMTVILARSSTSVQHGQATLLGTASGDRNIALLINTTCLSAVPGPKSAVLVLTSAGGVFDPEQ